MSEKGRIRNERKEGRRKARREGSWWQPVQDSSSCDEDIGYAKDSPDARQGKRELTEA